MFLPIWSQSPQSLFLQTLSVSIIHSLNQTINLTNIWAHSLPWNEHDRERKWRLGGQFSFCMELLHHFWFKICSSFQLNIYCIEMLLALKFHLRLKSPLTSTVYFLCPFRFSCIPIPSSPGHAVALRAHPACWLQPALSFPPTQNWESRHLKWFLLWKPLPPACTASTQGEAASFEPCSTQKVPLFGR